MLSDPMEPAALWRFRVTLSCSLVEEIKKTTPKVRCHGNLRGSGSLKGPREPAAATAFPFHITEREEILQHKSTEQNLPKICMNSQDPGGMSSERDEADSPVPIICCLEGMWRLINIQSNIKRYFGVTDKLLSIKTFEELIECFGLTVEQFSPSAGDPEGGELHDMLPIDV